MSSPKPFEEQLLEGASRVLEGAADTPDARLEVLEGASSIIGGFPLAGYRERFDSTRTLSDRSALDAASELVDALQHSPVPAELALCALARPRISAAERRTSGAYYTDFRLARHVADAAAAHLAHGARVIDPAAGTGILLVAAGLRACGPDRRLRASWLRESVTAWDLSGEALRGARLALASLTDDLSAVEAMVGRWRRHDSLLVEDAPWGEFDVVLGNPPWEKIKLTRHEFLRADGGARHYGDDYGRLDGELFATRKNEVALYGTALAQRYPLLGRGEPDLYKAFLELFLKLARPLGCVSALLPAGLIRSRGTEDLRRFLFEHAGDLSVTVLENRARFFAIDTRFKFLGLALIKAGPGAGGEDLHVVHAKGTEAGVEEFGRARVSRKVLEAIRPDLTVPEVRSEEEWRLFRRMSAHAALRGGDESPWEVEIVREVDMTRDRGHFARSNGPGRVALVEGRMIHQHRFGAKAYRHGTGRRARWEPVPPGAKGLMPQFWYPEDRMSDAVRRRAASPRAGFCDILGQTNERSMLAALVPPGVVCGNKVPTVRFPNDAGEDRLFLWLAVVNSIPFDWALRRIVTTTANYFVLRSAPFPALQPDSPPGRLLVDAARGLHDIDAGVGDADAWRVAELRASIDIAVQEAYGLDFADLELMLNDFPLLDRGQPPLAGEARSTVTRDLLLGRAAAHFGRPGGEYEERWRAAREAGAAPYVPSEFALAAATDFRARAI